MDYDSSSEEEEAPPIYECALAELLAEGVAADVRPLLQEFVGWRECTRVLVRR